MHKLKERYLSSVSAYQSIDSDVPEGIARVAQVMATYPAAWSLCGGWAVDAWLGRVSRDHGDIDLSVFVEDQQMLFEQLPGWQLLAHDAAWEPGHGDMWWDGRRPLANPSHIHGRPRERAGAMPANGIATTEDGFVLDIQIDARVGDEWVLLHDPMISLPLDRAVQPSPWGLPTASPEVLLFFKSRDLRRRDKTDFAATLPLLTSEQRTWLHDAITALGHPWQKELGD